MSVKVNVIGRLGSDADVKKSKAGNDFVSFRMATDEYQQGEKTTAWLSVIYPCNNATQMAEYLKKGRMVDVVGEETVRVYEDKNGVHQVSRDVIAYRINFVSIGSGQNSNGESQTTSQTTSVPKQQNVEQPTPAFAVPSVEDDLPF